MTPSRTINNMADSNKTTDEQEKKEPKRQKIRFARSDERKPRRERPQPEEK